MYRKIWIIAGFTSILSTFNEHQSSLIATLGPNLKPMFNRSIKRYGVEPTNGLIDTLQSGIVGLEFVGVLIGCYLISKLMDKRGRHESSVTLRGILGVVSIGSSILAYLFDSVELFAINFFISGINGSLKVIVIIYIGECAPLDLQGPITMIVAIGSYIVSFLYQPLLWPTTFANEERWVFIPVVNLIMCLIFWSVAAFLPESPKHLYMNLCDKLATKKALEFYHGRDANIAEVFEHYNKEIELAGAKTLSLKEVWHNKATRKSLLIVTILGLVGSFSVMTIKAQFFQQLLLDVGFAANNANFYMSIITWVATPFCILSIFLVHKIGHRPLMLFISFLCSFEWLLLTLAQWKVIPLVGFIGMLSGHLGAKLGLLSMPAIVLNEICPYASKGVITKFNQYTLIFLSGFVGMIYMPFEHSVGPIFNIPFILANIVLFGLIYKMLPETNAKHKKISTTTKNYGTVTAEQDTYRRLTVENNLMSVVGVPLTEMFNQSIQLHYDIVPNQNELDTVKSLISALNFLGILLGGYLIGHSMDSRGRKFTSVILRGALGLVASFCAIFSYFFTSVELFALGHFVSGINVSLKVCMIVYVAECAPVHLRGPVALLLNTGNFIIQLLLQPLIWPNVLGNEQRWVFIPAIALVLCMFHLSIASFFPESPKHLYLNLHRRVEAKQSLKIYHGYDVDTSCYLQVSKISYILGELFTRYDQERELVGVEHLSLKQVWQNKTTRLPLIIVTVAGLLPAFSALQIKGQFFQQILIDIGFTKATATFALNAIVISTTPFSFLSPYLIERGRRPLFLFMSMLCCIEWALLAVAQQWKTSSGISSIIGFAGLAFGHVAYKAGILTLPTIILNEIVPFDCKNAVIEFMQISSVCVSMVVALTYLPIQHNFGAIYNLPFLFISISLFCLLYSLLPETKMNKEPEALNRTTSYGAISGDFRRPSVISIEA